MKYLVSLILSDPKPGQLPGTAFTVSQEVTTQISGALERGESTILVKSSQGEAYWIDRSKLVHIRIEKEYVD